MNILKSNEKLVRFHCFLENKGHTNCHIMTLKKDDATDDSIVAIGKI